MVTAMRHERVEVPMRGDGSLVVGVVADTHSEPHARGLQHLAARKPDVILHGGDIGSLDVLAQLSEIAPVHAVRGNIDVRMNELPDVLTLALTHGGATQLRVLLTHIAVAGPKLRADAAKRARAEKASLVVCGHSHVPFLGEDRGLSIFNPGSIGPRRFSLPILFGVMELSPTAVSLRHVDCETGRDWLPG